MITLHRTLILLGLIAAIAFGAGLIARQARPANAGPRATRSEAYDTTSGSPAQLVLGTVDGCTYVIAYRLHAPGSGIGVVHHAACQNPAHRAATTTTLPERP